MGISHKQPEAETPERRVTVILDKRASEIADVLQDALGAGFHVVAFPPADDVIAVLTAAPRGWSMPIASCTPPSVWS